ncbi:ATP-binding protein [Actinomadura flavalba]|uniref:ATP-binding protein n=1 Tax=Actinomadura flavalba TaxID=1120938 RepID=UPI000361D8D0|nr:ATP-binding protein [Actinomadura flavalba]
MIVDQAHAVALPVADVPRRRHRPDADHVEAAPRPAAPAAPAWTEPVAASGLRGFWPTPHDGTPDTARLVLAGDAAAPGAARAFTTATLAGWGLEATRDDTVMAVSELVTNAVQHGLRDLAPGTAGRLQLVLLRHARRLVTVVTDPSAANPKPNRTGGDFPEGGRGLLVVGAVSEAWGWAPLGSGGKAVWAAFGLPPATD